MRVPWIGALVLVWTTNVLAQVWLPTGGDRGEIVPHTAYTLSYNETHEVANWVAYALRPEHLKDCVGRANNFYQDPSVGTGSASREDYYRSGYDRGHLAPAGDMKWNRQVMNESFYLSNITPQSPSMNRGRWAKLELLVRAWAKTASETVIATGPVLNNHLVQIGPNGVSVPEYHFKAILVTRGTRREAIAFLMPQNPTNTDLKTYSLSVRELEQLTGLNFFPHLSSREQNRLETEINWTAWNFLETFDYSSCSP